MVQVRFDRLTKRYEQDAAVRDLSLTVEDGELLCLLGPSGCGKSTLLRLAAGLEVPDAGEIALGSRTVSRPGAILAAPQEREIGFVFQDFALFPHLSVAENVGFGLEKMPAGERGRLVADALARVGMSDHSEDYPHTLSGGEQQRVALARAMAPGPRLFLLDEPFSGLDARLRRRLAEESWHLLKQAGVTTLLVTHDPEEAMLLGDRIAVMRAGRLVQVGTPTEIYAAPVSSFVAEFLSDVNRLVGVVTSEGTVETPFGTVAAGRHGPGTEVEVLIRHHAVSIEVAGAASAEAMGAVMARLRSVRPFGLGSLVRLQVDLPDGGRAVIRGRVPRTELPPEGTRVAVHLDPAHVFVFPKETK